MVRWAEEKDRWLQRNRGVSFSQIAERILSGEYFDVLENPSRPGQEIFVLRIEGYTWVVPFVVDADSIFLKTAFPSRRFHQRYGGADAKGEA